MKPNSTPTTQRQLCALAVALLTAAQTAPAAAADAANADGATSWVALCEGAIVLFRHAMAPGIGDPPQLQAGRLPPRTDARKLPKASVRTWSDVSDPVVSCMACQFDRQVYGIENDFA